LLRSLPQLPRLHAADSDWSKFALIGFPAHYHASV
jgi:hypothetical protein